MFPQNSQQTHMKANPHQDTPQYSWTKLEAFDLKKKEENLAMQNEGLK